MIHGLEIVRTLEKFRNYYGYQLRDNFRKGFKFSNIAISLKEVKIFKDMYDFLKVCDFFTKHVWQPNCEI